ncbi:MAG: FAD-dependent oxidoreductase [Patescibacteria group bacterium]
MRKADIAIIGAGIVGMATALKLKEIFPRERVVVLEKNVSPFLEASFHNSGVIHSGIHQKADLLKSKLARCGAPLLVDFCQRNSVLIRKSGMLIAVAAEDMASLIGDIKSLYLLIKNSRQQQIPIQFLTKFGIRKMEPNLKALFGIYLPDIWVVNQSSLAEALIREVRRNDIEIISCAQISAINHYPAFYELVDNNGQSYEAEIVINSAGARADEISALAGFSGYRVYLYRGEYYEVIGLKKDLIKSVLVYPALAPGSPVKGLHLTKTADGRLLIGPNITFWDNKNDDFSINSSRDDFFKAAKKFLPDLKPEDLKWAYSGLRAKINKGVGEDDFIIKKESSNPTFINLIGIESPGFTAAFAIADYVKDLIDTRHIQ